MEQNSYVRLAQSTKNIESVRLLFEQYAASLAIDLGYQGFQEEAAKLPGKYAAPPGCLLLGSGFDGAPIGCAGLRPLERTGYCEMKRLYVVPSARRLGLGRFLALRLIKEATCVGYNKLRLDTLGSMNEAVALYTTIGFKRIPAYYGPVPPDAVFMELDLLKAASRSVAIT